LHNIEERELKEMDISQILKASELVNSRKDGIRLLNDKAVRVNGEIVENSKIENFHFLHNKYLILQAGKKRHKLIVKTT
jgi:tyrosyl-tRNA synthetase